MEDNGRNGISFETSIGAIIRNNTVRRSAGDAVFISDVPERPDLQQLARRQFPGASNTSSTAARCPWGEDVKNNAAYDNTIVVGTQSYAYANAFSSTACTAAQLAPYMNGSKNLTFSRNTYSVPSATERYWLWDGRKYWNEWQALGQDLDGSMSQ